MAFFLQNHHHRITQPAFGGIPILVLRMESLGLSSIEGINHPAASVAGIRCWFLIIPIPVKTASFNPH
jgi:hypothetical protein